MLQSTVSQFEREPQQTPLRKAQLWKGCGQQAKSLKNKSKYTKIPIFWSLSLNEKRLTSLKRKKNKKDGPTVLKIQPMSSQTYTCSDTLAPKYILLHVHIDTDTDTCTHLLHSPSDANTARISQPTSPASPKLGLLFTRGTEVSTTFI